MSDWIEWVRERHQWIRDHGGTRLLAMTSPHDPYWCLMPSREQQGRWFADIWNAHGKPGMHLRRMHYAILSGKEPTTLLSGKPYQNTEDSFGWLQAGFTNARYLGLVDATHFEEHRSAEAILNATSRTAPTPRMEISSLLSSSFPTLKPISLSRPEPSITGYDYNDADQPFIVELWIEKSTMNDILVPLCEELHINLVECTGFASITRVVEMVHRAQEKPVRIFYVSDCDHSGKHMPVQVSRQVEFWRHRYAPESDIKLSVLALRPDQVVNYKLPRLFGTGATELDALEVHYPGLLALMVRDAMKPYRDATLKDRLRSAKVDARRQLEAAWDAKTTTERVAFASIQDRVNVILERHAAQLSKELEPLRLAVKTVQRRVRRAEKQFTVTLPPRPEPVVPPSEEEEWLFDSNRDYMEQHEAYSAYKKENQ